MKIVDKVTRKNVGHTPVPMLKHLIKAELKKGSLTRNEPFGLVATSSPTQDPVTFRSQGDPRWAKKVPRKMQKTPPEQGFP